MDQLRALIQSTEGHASPFEQAVRVLDVPVCDAFAQPDGGGVQAVEFAETEQTLGTKDAPQVQAAFPITSQKNQNKVMAPTGKTLNTRGKRVAVLFSGGPAAGGHNVVVGIYRALGPENTLLGTVAGPKGLLKGDFFEITEASLKPILNTGGFDFLGSDRTKIQSPEQFEQVKQVVQKHRLDGIIIVGGDDSNTNAALLAEALAPLGVTVVGVPKTIDGDLQLGDLLPISFGFDTATKIYAEMVGNILQDTPSSRKYWHFIKLMGRSASQVTLEVALQCKPAVSLISEEIWEHQMSLQEVVDAISETVLKRARQGIHHGVVLVPEGFIEFIPEMRSMMDSLNDVMGTHLHDISSIQELEDKQGFVLSRMDTPSKAVFEMLPVQIQAMLLLERDSHGNLPVSQIPTEELLIQMVAQRVLEAKEKDPSLDGFRFANLSHFFGYEGRCGAPTLFDASFCLNLGLAAGSLVLGGHTGYMASVSSLTTGGKVLALPLTGLLNIERRHGKNVFVIAKALVDVKSPAFRFFAERRGHWAEADCFTSPGPRQLWGPLAKLLPYSVALNRGYVELGFDLGKEVALFEAGFRK